MIKIDQKMVKRIEKRLIQILEFRTEDFLVEKYTEVSDKERITELELRAVKAKQALENFKKDYK